MNDLFHVWGTDIGIGATGDLAIASGEIAGQQRVLRRLLTNPGDYIWQPVYGAGLARFVGSPVSESQIKAIIRSQIFKESSVSRTPEPVIEVQTSPGGPIGAVYVRIQYADSTNNQTQTLAFTIGN